MDCSRIAFLSLLFACTVSFQSDFNRIVNVFSVYDEEIKYIVIWCSRAIVFSLSLSLILCGFCCRASKLYSQLPVLMHSNQAKPWNWLVNSILNEFKCASSMFRVCSSVCMVSIMLFKFVASIAFCIQLLCVSIRIVWVHRFDVFHVWYYIWPIGNFLSIRNRYQTLKLLIFEFTDSIQPHFVIYFRLNVSTRGKNCLTRNIFEYLRWYMLKCPNLCKTGPLYHWVKSVSKVYSAHHLGPTHI